MSEFKFFLPIAKVDKEKRIVSGYASTPTRDSDGEIVTLEAVQAALPDYMRWGNIREMHKLSAVGTAEEANVDQKGLFLTAKIVDDVAWQKCLEGVYKGFSIGGRKLAKVGDKITELEMTEISVVDRPANPDAEFALAKSKKETPNLGYLLKAKVASSPQEKALKKMAQVVETLAKANPPAAHDGFSLPANTTKNASPKDDSEQNNKADDKDKPCEAHGVVGCEKCAVEKRDFNAKERREDANSGAAMPDGSFPIENAEDLTNAIRLAGHGKNPKKAKAHIKARAKALGLEDKLPEDWSGKGKKDKKEAKKLAKAQLAAALGIKSEGFLTLNKRMGTAGTLAYSFDSIRDVQRSLMMEAKREGGDMKDKELAKELGSIALDLSRVISQKALHEGEEARTMTDADDDWVNSMLGDDFAMTTKANTVVSTGDPLTDAMAVLMKRAAMPTKAQRMEMAEDNVKKSRKAAKAAREAIEDCHKMHKAAYLSKMTKAKKGDKEPDGDEFDHAGAMEKLQKAYGEIDKARTFAKAAMGQIEKAAGRSGQKGQEVSDAEGGFYEVPAGVKDLSPANMAGAAPGTSGGAGQPPLYPDDGSVYAGKADGVGDLRKFAKNGQIPADMVELILAKAKAEGELAALRQMPAMPSGGRRPQTFDMSKVMGGTMNPAQDADMNKALFDGVNVHDLQSGDENRHTQASAKVIGNFLTSGHFGKSLFDPSFKGAAGTAR